MTMTPEKQQELRESIRAIREEIERETERWHQEIVEAEIALAAASRNLKSKKSQPGEARERLRRQQHRLASQLSGGARETDPDLK
jgi:chromosome segregation ATPase